METPPTAIPLTRQEFTLLAAGAESSPQLAIPGLASDLFYTVAELSARWKCDPESVRRKIWSGELPATKPAGKHLVSEAAVLAAEVAAATKPRQTQKQ